MKIAVTAVRCRQFGRSAYLASVKFKDLSAMVRIDPEVQRELSNARVNKLHRYIVKGCGFLPAITVSSQNTIRTAEVNEVFMLILDNDVEKLAINDGQHRVKAVEKAVRTNPELGETELPVLIFEQMPAIDQRQLFHDLNFYPTKVPKAKAVSFDSSDLVKTLTKRIAEEVTYFADGVERSKQRLGSHDTAFTTLGILYESTLRFVGGTEVTSTNFDDILDSAMEYWEAVGDVLGKEWQRRGKSLAVTGNAFVALGRLGNRLGMVKDSDERTAIIGRLSDIDWDREDNEDWAGYMFDPTTGALITGSTAFANTTRRLYKLLGIDEETAA